MNNSIIMNWRITYKTEFFCSVVFKVTLMFSCLRPRSYYCLVTTPFWSTLSLQQVNQLKGALPPPPPHSSTECH